MSVQRYKDQSWGIHAHPDTGIVAYEAAQLAVLMDLRDELKLIREELHNLNNTFYCPNFQAVPRILRAIEKNTTRKPRARKKKTTT